MAPIVGISKMLGYRFYRPVAEGWRDFEPVIGEHVSDRDYDVLVIHESDVSGVLASGKL